MWSCNFQWMCIPFKCIKMGICPREAKASKTKPKSTLSQKINNDNDHRSDEHVVKISKGCANAEDFTDNDIREILKDHKNSDSEVVNSTRLSAKFNDEIRMRIDEELANAGF